MSKQDDRMAVTLLPNTAGVALTPHALAPGMSESTTDSQCSKAIAYWTAIQSAGGLDARSANAVSDAISHLTALQAYVRNPASNPKPESR